MRRVMAVQDPSAANRYSNGAGPSPGRQVERFVGDQVMMADPQRGLPTAARCTRVAACIDQGCGRGGAAGEESVSVISPWSGLAEGPASD